MIKEKIRSLYKNIRYGIKPSFEAPRYFLNNAKGTSSACFILSGYKQFTWEIVFKRLKKFCPRFWNVIPIAKPNLRTDCLESELPTPATPNADIAECGAASATRLLTR